MTPRWILLFALALLPPAHADEAEEKGPQDDRVTVALDLFGEACVKQAGRLDQVATWALQHGVAELETDRGAFFLHGMKGTVWSAPTDNGQFVLVAREPASCSVWAYRANAKEAETWLEKLLAHSVRQSDKVDKAFTREFDGAGGKYQLHAWRVRGDGAALLFTLTTTESDADDVPAQVIISVSPVADDNPAK